MLTNCLICNSELHEATIEKEYEAAGWNKQFPDQTEPTEFKHFKCDHCDTATDDYFAVSYLGGHLWCLYIEEAPGIYVFNNYIADTAVINTMDSDSVKKTEDIKLKSALKLDLTDLEKIREQVQAYVIFC